MKRAILLNQYVEVMLFITIFILIAGILYISLKKESKYPTILISAQRESAFLIHLKEVNPLKEVNVENKIGKFRFWDWDFKFH